MKEEKIVTLDLTGCKYLGEIHQRIKKAFNFPDFYGENWSAFDDLLWSECDADKVVIIGEETVSNELDRMTVFWTVFCGLFKILSSVFISCLEQKSIQLQIELEFSYSIFGEVCPRYRTRCIRQRMLRVLLLCDTHCGIPVLF